MLCTCIIVVLYDPLQQTRGPSCTIKIFIINPLLSFRRIHNKCSSVVPSLGPYSSSVYPGRCLIKYSVHAMNGVHDPGATQWSSRHLEPSALCLSSVVTVTHHTNTPPIWLAVIAVGIGKHRGDSM